MRNIAKLVSKWTGRIWNITYSDSSTGKTLAEEDIIIKEKNLEEIRKDPDIKKILDTFPGSTIHSFDLITDEKEKELKQLEPIQKGKP